ncbi:H-NS histone family protein [Roseovarius aestuarii]|nr:H-NS histone family protein [Roseovarius aestuarii]
MAQMDLTALSLRELKSLKKKVDRAIETHEKRARKDALAAIKEKAKEMGFSLNELVGPGDADGAGTTSGTRTPAGPKYRDPRDETQTWSGRGRKPNWIKKAIDEGADLESMRISE